MALPLVIAYHLIFTIYGAWLPNDLRGSTSHRIRDDLIAELGELHYGRKIVQPSGEELRAFQREAASRLQHPLLEFTDAETAIVAAAIGGVIERQRYTCWACAIMPDHVHLCIRKHKEKAEDMLDKLRQECRSRLRDSSPRFASDHPVWGGPGWKTFLEHPGDVRRVIRYIERNPVKLRRPRQDWPFVTSYDGWPLHPGHSPNSPYAKRLRAAGRYPHG